MRAVWVFLLWRADHVNGVVGLFGCSRVGCQVLPGVEAANCWLWGLIMRQLTVETWRPKASAILLMGRVRIQENLGLLSTYWWMKPDPGASASLLVNGARSWGLVTGPRGPRANVRFLVVGAGSQHG